MRKFIAYLTLLIATVLGIALSVKPLLSSVNSELDFNGGQTFIYQLTNADENIADQTTPFEDESKIYDVAKEMESRLVNYGVQQYDIKIDGNDTLRVSFYESNSEKYNHISSYLKFDGKLALATSDNEFIFANYSLDGQTLEDMFERNSYITFNGYYPAVVLPVKNVEKMQEAIDHAISLDEKGEDDKDTSDPAYLYMWNGWDENCVYTNKDKYPVIAEKMVLRYDSNNIWYEQNENDHASIVVYFNVASDENATSLNMSEVRAANENAKYLNALINAKEYDGVTVNLVNSENIGPVAGAATIETTTITPVVNFVVIGFIIAFGVCLLGAFVFARLLGVTFVINEIAGLIITSAICVALGATYSVATVAALGVYTAISLSLAFIYASKIKKNLAEQPNVQKACIDANKSVLMLHVDSAVVMAIVGIFIYSLAGSYLSTMGIVFIVGGVVSLLINLLLNRLSFITLAQSKFGSKLGLFGIFDKVEEKPEEPKEINVLDEMKKQQALEASKNRPAPKPFMPSKLIIGILYGVILLGGIITMSIMSATNTPYVEQSLLDTADTRLVVYADKDNLSLKTSDDLKAVIDTVTLGDDNSAIYNKESTTSIETFESVFYTHTADLADSTAKTYVYYIVHIDTTYDVSNCLIKVNGETQVVKDLGVVLEQVITDKDPVAFVSLKLSKSYGLTGSYFIGNVALAMSVALVGAVIYLAIRYRTTLAIALGLISLSVSTVALTCFSMLRIAVFSYVSIVPLTAIMLGVFFAVVMLEGNQLKAKLAKGETLNYDQKVDQFEISFETTINYMIIAAALSALLSLAMALSNIHAIRQIFVDQMIIGLLAFFVPTLFALPCYKLLMKFTGKIAKASDKGPKSNKKKLRNKHKEHQRGKEVEEATFIGIND